MDKDKLVEIKDSITEDITLGNLKDIARQVKMTGFSKYKSDTKNELIKLLKKFIKNLIKQKTPPSPKPKKGKTSKEKHKTPSKKDVEPAKESEYKKRDLIKKSIEELKRLGINVRAVNKTSILYGIQKMKQFKIYLHNESVDLISEFTNFKFKKDRTGAITNNTIGKDHLIDALKYGIVQFLDRPKNKITII